MNVWKILGIHPTYDKALIRNTYAQKAKQCHPEEHPEEFQQLNEAYRRALSMASQKKENQYGFPSSDFFSVTTAENDSNFSKDFSTDAHEPRLENKSFDFSYIITGTDEDPRRTDAECRRVVLQELLKLFKQNEKRLDIWRSVFKSERFFNVMNEPQFIGDLTNYILNDYLRSVRFAVCKEIRKIYFLSGERDPNMPPYRQLSKVLEQRKSKAQELYLNIKWRLFNYIYKSYRQY